MRQAVYTASADSTFLSRVIQPARNWYALYTASNQEKRVEEHLRRKGVEVFLPLYEVTRRWKNRTTRKIELPLFTGYLFARIALTERVRVLEVPTVISIVGNGKELLPIPANEIDTLRNGLRLRQVDPYPYLKVGNRARIRSGALTGLEGVVVRKDGQLRVVISIDCIMRSFGVHVCADELEACV